MPKITLPAPRRRRVNHGLPAGICRVEQPSTRTFGYVTRAVHKPDREKRTWRPKFKAYFGDHSHGGKQAALAAASRWMRTLARTGKPPEKKAVRR